MDLLNTGGGKRTREMPCMQRSRNEASSREWSQTIIVRRIVRMITRRRSSEWQHCGQGVESGGGMWVRGSIWVCWPMSAATIHEALHGHPFIV